MKLNGDFSYQGFLKKEYKKEVIKWALTAWWKIIWFQSLNLKIKKFSPFIKLQRYYNIFETIRDHTYFFRKLCFSLFNSLKYWFGMHCLGTTGVWLCWKYFWYVWYPNVNSYSIFSILLTTIFEIGEQHALWYIQQYLFVNLCYLINLVETKLTKGGKNPRPL